MQRQINNEHKNFETLEYGQLVVTGGKYNKVKKNLN